MNLADVLLTGCVISLAGRPQALVLVIKGSDPVEEPLLQFGNDRVVGIDDVVQILIVDIDSFLLGRGHPRRTFPIGGRPVCGSFRDSNHQISMVNI